MEDMRIVMGEKLAVNKADNLVVWLSRTASTYPESIAVIDENTTLTYKELDTLSNGVAVYLLELVPAYRALRLLCKAQCFLPLYVLFDRIFSKLEVFFFDFFKTSLDVLVFESKVISPIFDY